MTGDTGTIDGKGGNNTGVSVTLVAYYRNWPPPAIRHIWSRRDSKENAPDLPKRAYRVEK